MNKTTTKETDQELLEEFDQYCESMIPCPVCDKEYYGLIDNKRICLMCVNVS